MNIPKPSKAAACLVLVTLTTAAHIWLATEDAAASTSMASANPAARTDPPKGNDVVSGRRAAKSIESGSSRKKTSAKNDGKLSAGGRILAALEQVLGGPIAGAYIGTAGGYIPTAPGFIGGAAIGGVIGIARGLEVLVTGRLDDGGTKNGLHSGKSDWGSPSPAIADLGSTETLQIAGVSGGSYVGQTVDGKRHGYGKMRYNKGNSNWIRVYEGRFAQDRENGRGRCRLATGQWRWCEFSNGSLLFYQ